MFNHAPLNYDCPFCKFAKGIETEQNKKTDIVYENDKTLAFISPKWWINNPGHVLVIPKEHLENIYDISDQLLGEVYATAKKISLALKFTYKCDGTSTLQQNEPGGGQSVWHLHVHVFPRYDNDNLYLNHNKYGFLDENKRALYAEKLRKYFKQYEI